MKEYSIDRLLHKLIDRYMFEAAMALLLLLSWMIRRRLAPVEWSGDYNGCIVPWVEEYRFYGVRGGLSRTIGNYYVPYNILLAIISLFPWKPYVLVEFYSCLTEYVSAVFLYRILRLLGKTEQKPGGRAALAIAVATLYLPAVILNGSLWKQCDGIYTCFVVIGLYFLFKENYTAAFAFASVGFVFKMQAIFIFPLLMLVYIVKKSFSILQILWYPGMYLAAGLPAILCGRDAKETYYVYFQQMKEYDGMVMNSANVYSFGLWDFETLSKPAVFFTMAIFIAAAVYVHTYGEKMTQRRIFYLAGWCAWTCYMFLPAMHERYDYMALLLTTVYLLAYGGRLRWAAAVMNLCAVFTYGNYLFGGTGLPLAVIAAPYCAAYFAVTCDLMREFRGSGGNV